MKLKFVVFLIPILVIASSLQAQLQIEGLVDPNESTPGEEGSVVNQPTSASHGSGGSGPALDVLDFLMGDRMSGDLLGIEEQKLRWKHPDAVDSMSFVMDNLQGAVLKGRRDVGGLLKLARVEMTNGDIYRGKIVSMSGNNLVIETPYAGNVTLVVAHVKSIRPATESKIVYEGPNSLEEWKTNQNSWAFNKGTLTSRSGNQSIGRVIDDLPDMASIEMDLAWRGNAQINIGFWGENPESIHQNSHTLMIQGSYVRLFRYSNTHGGNDLGAINFEAFQTSTRATLGLKLDRKGQNIALFVDGVLAKQWKDTSPGPLTGSALILQSTSGNALRVSNIRVTQWDGKFGGAGSEEGQGETDMAEFSNGDKFSGKLEQIANGQMKFVTDFATFDVPVQRVARVELASKTREQARRHPGDVEVFFPTEERITLRLNTLGNEFLKGSSQNSGDLNLRRSMITKLRFNIYDPRQQKTEEEW